jgi:hypothetical protein
MTAADLIREHARALNPELGILRLRQIDFRRRAGLLANMGAAAGSVRLLLAASSARALASRRTANI